MALRKALILGALMGTGAGVGSTLFVLVTPGEQRKQRMLQVGSNPKSIGKRGWGLPRVQPLVGFWDLDFLLFLSCP